MAAITFPTSPTNGQVFTSGSRAWVWNSSVPAWEEKSQAQIAANVTNTPAGNIAATTVQAAINELDTEKLPLAGGTMAGNLVLDGTANSAPNQTAASGSSLMTRGLVDERLVDSGCIIFKDDFSCGGRTDKIIGETGWGMSGTSAAAVERSSSGVFPNHTAFRFTSGSTSGQFNRIYTLNTIIGAAANFATMTGWKAKLIFAIVDVTSVTFACGFAANPNATDFQDRLVGVRFKSGVDTNFQFICKNDVSTFALSAASTLADSGVAAQNNVFVNVDMQCVTAGTIQFRINGGAWSNITTNIPTILTGLLFFWCEPTSNAARAYDVDFASWKVEVTR